MSAYPVASSARPRSPRWGRLFGPLTPTTHFPSLGGSS